jgi:hypothetical protein
VKKEKKKKFSLFPRLHHRRSESETHAAAVVQQLVVEPEREREVVTRASVVPTPEARSSSKATGSPPTPGHSLSKGWFFGSLKGFFDPRQSSTPHGSPDTRR